MDFYACLPACWPFLSLRQSFYKSVYLHVFVRGLVQSRMYKYMQEGIGWHFRNKCTDAQMHPPFATRTHRFFCSSASFMSHAVAYYIVLFCIEKMAQGRELWQTTPWSLWLSLSLWSRPTVDYASSLKHLPTRFLPLCLLICILPGRWKPKQGLYTSVFCVQS